jgi:hypothetical protein
MQQTFSNLLFLETVDQSGFDVKLELRHHSCTCKNAKHNSKSVPPTYKLQSRHCLPDDYKTPMLPLESFSRPYAIECALQHVLESWTCEFTLACEQFVCVSSSYHTVELSGRNRHKRWASDALDLLREVTMGRNLLCLSTYRAPSSWTRQRNCQKRTC